MVFLVKGVEASRLAVKRETVKEWTGSFGERALNESGRQRFYTAS